MAEENLYEVLRAGSAGNAHRPFLTPADGSRGHTYGEVFDRAGRIAGALLAHDVAPGDRIVVRVHKSADAVALYLACLQIGAIYVTLNTAYTDEELRFFVDDAAPALVVLDPAAATSDLPRIATLGVDGDGSLLDRLPDRPSTEFTERRGDDVAAMLYTSGTTGRSKGAMLTHRGLITNGRALHDIWGFTADDVLLHILPVFHVHGLFVALHCAMLAGAECIFLPRFDPDAIVGALARSTVLMGVPTHYVRLLADDRFDTERCSNIRLLTSGSAPMTEGVHAEVTARTGHRVLERYGMTETGIITSNPLDGERIPGTVGFALPDMEVRIATDAGVCAPGETGVVEVRGQHLFAGYWRLPDKTAAEHRPDGFFITGDVGTMDEHGRVRLEGRAGDMIISGGENVYPKEIELCLDETAGVIESAVVGLPHPDFGEAVVAFVVTDETFDEAAVRRTVDAHLARFKQPKVYLPLPELPRNAMGKVQKAALRAAHAHHFSS